MFTAYAARLITAKTVSVAHDLLVCVRAVVRMPTTNVWYRVDVVAVVVVVVVVIEDAAVTVTVVAVAFRRPCFHGADEMRHRPVRIQSYIQCIYTHTRAHTIARKHTRALQFTATTLHTRQHHTNKSHKHAHTQKHTHTYTRCDPSRSSTQKSQAPSGEHGTCANNLQTDAGDWCAGVANTVTIRGILTGTHTALTRELARTDERFATCTPHINSRLDPTGAHIHTHARENASVCGFLAALGSFRVCVCRWAESSSSSSSAAAAAISHGGLPELCCYKSHDRARALRRSATGVPAWAAGGDDATQISAFRAWSVCVCLCVWRTNGRPRAAPRSFDV